MDDNNNNNRQEVIEQTVDTGSELVGETTSGEIATEAGIELGAEVAATGVAMTIFGPIAAVGIPIAIFLAAGQIGTALSKRSSEVDRRFERHRQELLNQKRESENAKDIVNAQAPYYD